MSKIQSIINGHISGTRNVFSLTTIGVTMYGFSKSFKKKSSEITIRLFSSVVYILAILYLINTNLSLRSFLNNIENSNEDIPKHINLQYWKNYEYIVWLYLVMLLILSSLSLRRYIF